MPTPFKEALESGKFVVTSEVAPPKGTNLDKFKHHVELLRDKVDAMNVTDNQSSVMRFPSIGGCLLVKELGGEAILQMTCRDRNRLALQADLLFANYQDIDNVLCLTGDSIILGDHKEAKSVFDMDSSQLLETVRIMENGKDLGGNDLDGEISFCAGAIVTPDTLQRAWQLGLRAQDALACNDGHGFFEALGDAVVTGPTMTNVNDFRAILIAPDLEQLP